MNKPFSLFWEIQTTLYLGVFFFILGLGVTIKKHFAELGHPLIIGALTLGCAAAFIYCFKKKGPYTTEKWDPPHILFPYILYLGCVLLSLDVSYIETQFHLLGDWWQTYLLAAALLFGFFAYRFDNRLVLALSLTTLAAWFGFSLNQSHFDIEKYLRPSALVYGAVLLCAGTLLYRASIKRHFLDTYLNFAANFLFIALVWGTSEFRIFSLYFAGLLLLSGAAIYWGFKANRFLYVAYGIIYGYVGFSTAIGRFIGSSIGGFFYLIISSITVLVTLIILGLKFKK